MTYVIAPSADIITAASGPDDGLAEELRAALVAAALSYVEGLRVAQTSAAWTHGARRLAGLASSFGAAELHAAATAALDGDMASAVAVAQIDAAIAQLRLRDLQKR